MYRAMAPRGQSETGPNGATTDVSSTTTTTATMTMTSKSPNRSHTNNGPTTASATTTSLVFEEDRQAPSHGPDATLGMLNLPHLQHYFVGDGGVVYGGPKADTGSSAEASHNQSPQPGPTSAYGPTGGGAFGAYGLTSPYGMPYGAGSALLPPLYHPFQLSGHQYMLQQQGSHGAPGSTSMRPNAVSAGTFGYACDRCREKHQSCDHEKPCKRCIKANVADFCHYTPKRSRTKAGSGGAMEAVSDGLASPSSASTALGPNGGSHVAKRAPRGTSTALVSPPSTGRRKRSDQVSQLLAYGQLSGGGLDYGGGGPGAAGLAFGASNVNGANGICGVGGANTGVTTFGSTHPYGHLMPPGTAFFYPSNAAAAAGYPFALPTALSTGFSGGNHGLALAGQPSCHTGRPMASNGMFGTTSGTQQQQQQQLGEPGLPHSPRATKLNALGDPGGVDVVEDFSLLKRSYSAPAQQIIAEPLPSLLDSLHFKAATASHLCVNVGPNAALPSNGMATLASVGVGAGNVKQQMSMPLDQLLPNSMYQSSNDHSPAHISTPEPRSNAVGSTGGAVGASYGGPVARSLEATGLGMLSTTSSSGTSSLGLPSVGPRDLAKKMDGSALLAAGILVQESMRDSMLGLSESFVHPTGPPPPLPLKSPGTNHPAGMSSSTLHPSHVDYHADSQQHATASNESLLALNAVASVVSQPAPSA